MNNPAPLIKIVIADDQKLFLEGLARIISKFKGFKVIRTALNGRELLSWLIVEPEQPHIAILDVTMPEMNGWETASNIAKSYPDIKMVALSMKNDDTSVIKMFKAGCSAYLLKDIDPPELEKALLAVYRQGYYNADSIHQNLRRIIAGDSLTTIQLSDRERHFLQLACSDLTYREIASQMCLSEKTVDGYRESIFIKFNVKSRVGMALEAIRQNFVAV